MTSQAAAFLPITLYQIAERYIGTTEVPGTDHNPAIMAMLRLDADWPDGDEVPWCSAFLNHCAWLLRLPRSKSLRARSWLTVGKPIDTSEARVGFDIVVLQRGAGEQPGPEVIDAPGHVGLFAGAAWDRDRIGLLGGNQSNAVTVAEYDPDRILGVRRLYP